MAVQKIRKNFRSEKGPAEKSGNQSAVSWKKIVTTEARAKEVRKIAEGIIAMGVRKKTISKPLRLPQRLPEKDKDGKRVKETVDGKKVTVYDEVEKEIKKDLPSRLHARRQMLKVLLPDYRGSHHCSRT